MEWTRAPGSARRSAAFRGHRPLRGKLASRWSVTPGSVECLGGSPWRHRLQPPLCDVSLGPCSASGPYLCCSRIQGALAMPRRHSEDGAPLDRSAAWHARDDARWSRVSKVLHRARPSPGASPVCARSTPRAVPDGANAPAPSSTLSDAATGAGPSPEPGNALLSQVIDVHLDHEGITQNPISSHP